MFRRKKRGRFIPCRGGGTATTYYTDWHDVDEDLRTASMQSGWWCADSWAGIMYRGLEYDSTGEHTTVTSWIIASSLVASRLIYLS